MTICLVLAAGSSRRMGQPKPLIRLGNTSLLTRAVQAARAAGATPWVLFGTLDWGEAADGAVCLHVERAAEGMGITIATGIAALPDTVTRCLITPIDLPNLDAAHLRALMTACDPVSATVLPSGRIGAPACFDRVCFAALRGLTGDRGARDLLRGDRWPVCAVTPAQSLFDIDTPAELARAQHELQTTEAPCV